MPDDDAAAPREFLGVAGLDLDGIRPLPIPSSASFGEKIHI